jgi:hypothetical protein
LSIDPKANPAKGFQGTIADFTKANQGLKVNQIIADNPYGYYDYVDDAANLLESGGTLTVRGTITNRFFKQILTGKAKGLENFIIGTRTKIPDQMKVNMKSTTGEDIKGDVFEITLKRK